MESPWKPYLRENILNPYPMYKALRENDPIHRAPSGEWVVTRYQDAKTILKDDSFHVGNRAEWLNKVTAKHMDKWETFSAVVDALKAFIVFKNPPDHTLLRKLIMQAWNNRDVDLIIKNNIQSILREADPDQMDIANDVATPLPTMTMTKILGLPEEDYNYLGNLSHQMMKSLDFYLTFREIEKMAKATEAFVEYFERLAKQKLKHPDNGLLSRLITLNKNPTEVPHHELIANCFFLFIAGGETTAGLIGPGLYHLVSQHKMNRNLANPGSIKKATEELLRYDAPTQLVGRIATMEVQLADHKFEEGDLITVCLGAANRDPGKFDHPEDLMLERTPNQHLAFSTGIHRCLGDWLAKREFELLAETLLERFKSFSILQEPVWKENFNFRCLQSFKLSCK